MDMPQTIVECAPVRDENVQCQTGERYARCDNPRDTMKSVFETMRKMIHETREGLVPSRTWPTSKRKWPASCWESAEAQIG